MFLTCCSPANSSGSAELALEVVVGRAGDQHAARLAQLLQAGGDVDAVAEQVVAVHDDVAEVDADAEHDPAVGWPASACPLATTFWIATAQATASTTERELDDRAVAHQLDDPALVLGQQRVDRRARAALLIAASVPASSCSIRRE